MASKRRYKITNDTQIYHEYFDRKRMNSSVLNSEFMVDIHTVMLDKRNIQSLILERVGDDSGMYNRPGERRMYATIPAIEIRLKEVEQKYEQHKQQQINSGRPPDTQMPPELSDEKYRLEAEFDVVSEEVESLESALKEFTDLEDVRKNDLMLRYGPRGASRLHQGFCVEWDYMEVAPTENGVQSRFVENLICNIS